MKIFCIFSVENQYDQPDHNLVMWFQRKPSFETVLTVIGGNFENEASILAAANLIQHGSCRYPEGSFAYTLAEVEEGTKPC